MRFTGERPLRRLETHVIVLAVIVGAVVAAFLGTLLAAAVSSAPPAPAAAFGVAQTPAATTSTTVTEPFATVPVPAGFAVESSSSSSVTLVDRTHHGRVVVTEATDAGANPSGIATELTDLTRSALDPNAGVCPDDTVDTFSLQGGSAPIPASYVPLCVSVVPQNAPAFTARDYWYAAAANNGGRPVLLTIEVFASTSDFGAVTAELQGFAPAVHWTASAPS